jgi:hypothetical protein
MMLFLLFVYYTKILRNKNDCFCFNAIFINSKSNYALKEM